MTTTADALNLGWTDVTVKYGDAIEKEIGDITVSIGDAWVLSAGEYATEGEPDLIVQVTHAVDIDGTDVRARLAVAIAAALESFAHAEGSALAARRREDERAARLDDLRG